MDNVVSYVIRLRLRVEGTKDKRCRLVVTLLESHSELK